MQDGSPNFFERLSRFPFIFVNADTSAGQHPNQIVEAFVCPTDIRHPRTDTHLGNAVSTTHEQRARAGRKNIISMFNATEGVFLVGKRNHPLQAQAVQEHANQLPLA